MTSSLTVHNLEGIKIGYLMYKEHKIMELSLSKLEWELKGYWPYVPLKVVSMETGQIMHGVTDWLPAKVPGGVHVALWEAGIINNPYFGLNSLNCEWVENRWWMYRTRFDRSWIGDYEGKRLNLVFKGLDYEVDVFLNNEIIGNHKGMFTKLSVDITDKLLDENELIVVFKSVPEEMGQIGYTSKTKTQKSRFNYKWDFSTRLVNIGFWKDVVLEIKDEKEFEDIKIDTNLVDNDGIVHISGIVKTYNNMGCDDVFVKTTLSKSGRENTVIVPVINGTFSSTIAVEDPDLWWPNGVGKPELYKLNMQLIESNRVMTEVDCRMGIRKVQFIQNTEAPDDALPYTCSINGEKVYIKGVNITPIDHVYGDVRDEQYQILVQQMANANINLVRVWGGGLIEKEIFYDLCDQYGIMVWQDFIQSSSGLDNKPSEDPEFLSLLKESSTEAIKNVRNHPSLVLYCGGNELMESGRVPVTFDNKNIGMLRQLVNELDNKTMFLPATASGPREHITKDKNISHDVHGWWHYEGNPGHYELYGELDNLFHSEFGVAGCSSLKSLEKFLPEEDLIPTIMSNNLRWMHHGEWWDTLERDRELFGAFQRNSLESFVKASQFIQSEGLRYIVESNARRAFRNSGSIVWQLNEPWPNASCTSLIDYYGETKSVYYALKRVYEEDHVSLVYRCLNETIGTSVSYPVFLTNTKSEKDMKIVAIVRDNNGRKYKEQEFLIQSKAFVSNYIGKFQFDVPKVDNYFVTVKAYSENQLISENTYTYGTKENSIFSSLLEDKTTLQIKEISEKKKGAAIEKKVLIKNIGTKVALDIFIELEKDHSWMLADDNYIPLFPGEERVIKLILTPKKADTFLSESITKEDSSSLRLSWLGK